MAGVWRGSSGRGLAPSLTSSSPICVVALCRVPRRAPRSRHRPLEVVADQPLQVLHRLWKPRLRWARVPEARVLHHRQRRRHHDEVARVFAHGAHGADRLTLHDDAPVRVPPQARDARAVPDEIPERRVARRQLDGAPAAERRARDAAAERRAAGRARAARARDGARGGRPLRRARRVRADARDGRRHLGARRETVRAGRRRSRSLSLALSFARFVGC